MRRRNDGCRPVKAKIVLDTEGRFYGIRIDCPYCYCHTLPVRWLPPGKIESPHVAKQPHWDFNGDFESPTFSPSILSTAELGSDRQRWVCHSFVRGGCIEYLMDCTHDGAGKTVTLDDIE